MRRQLFRLGCLALLLSGPTTLSSQPALVGPETTLAIGGPFAADLLVDRDGKLTVFWESGLQLQARRFDAEGRSLGADLALGLTSGFDVAATADGFVVVGLDDSTLYPRTLGRTFDRLGGPLRAPFLVDLAQAPAQSTPRVAASAAGGFGVVWVGREPNLGRRIASFRRFSAAGVGQGPALRIFDPDPSRDVVDADLLSASDGRYLVVSFGLAPSRVSGQIVAQTGATVGPLFSLCSGTVLQPPAVTFTADGGLLAVWYGSSAAPSVTTGIFGRLYGPTGTPRGEVFTLEVAGDNSLSAPVVAADGEGRLVAAWLNGSLGLRVAEIGIDGSVGPILARPNALYAGTPLLAAAWGDGRFALAWGLHERVSRNPLGLGLQRFASGGGPGVLRFESARAAGLEGSGVFVVRVERRDGNRGAVGVQYRLRSNVARLAEDYLPFAGTLSFADGESNPLSLTIPVLDDALPEAEETLLLELANPTGGAALAPPIRAGIEIRDDDRLSPLLLSAPAPFELQVGSEDLFARAANPVVAALAGGGFVAAWERYYDRYPFPPRQGSVLADAEGREVARSLWFAEGARRMRIAAQDDGGFTLTGEAIAFPGTIPYDLLGTFGERFDASGRTPDPPFALADAPWALAAGRRGGLFALLGDSSRGGVVSLQRLDSSGRPSGALLRVTAAGGSSALAPVAHGAAIVAWTEGPAGARRLLVRRLRADGRWLGGVVVADPLAERQPGRIALAAAPDGRFVVVWEALHDGDGLGLFGRRFGASGEPLGGVFLVNSRTAGDQLSPRVGVQGDGRFIVVWEGAVKGVPRLCGQYFAADGTRLGSEMLMVDDDPLWGEGQAALANDGMGRYTLVWTRLRRPDEVSGRRFWAP